MVRQGHLIAVVGTFVFGCAVLLVVGCAGTRSEAPKEQAHTEVTKEQAEEGRCEGTRNKNHRAMGSIYKTNDIPGCPKGGRLLGTDAGDPLAGEAGDDEVRGLGGSDELYGGPGNDVIYGGSGAFEFLSGGRGDDVLYGGPGDDVMGGTSAGNSHGKERDKEVLYGGDGGDNLEGGKGKDVLYGGMAKIILARPGISIRISSFAVRARTNTLLTRSTMCRAVARRASWWIPVVLP